MIEKLRDLTERLRDFLADFLDSETGRYAGIGTARHGTFVSGWVEKLRDLTERLRDFREDLTEGLRDFLEDLTEKLRDFREDLTERPRDFLEDLTERLRDFREDFRYLRPIALRAAGMVVVASILLGTSLAFGFFGTNYDLNGPNDQVYPTSEERDGRSP